MSSVHIDLPSEGTELAPVNGVGNPAFIFIVFPLPWRKIMFAARAFSPHLGISGQAGIMVPESPLKWYEDFVYKYIFWGKDSCLHMFWPIVWFPLRRLASEISTWTSQQVSLRLVFQPHITNLEDTQLFLSTYLVILGNYIYIPQAVTITRTFINLALGQR